VPTTLWTTNDAHLVIFGSGQGVGECKIPEMLKEQQVVDISGGYFHSVALTDNGQLVCFGDSQWCEIPAEVSEGMAVAVAAGSYHTVVVMSDGKVIAFGIHGKGRSDIIAFHRNAKGQCDIPAKCRVTLHNVHSTPALPDTEPGTATPAIATALQQLPTHGKPTRHCPARI